MLYGNYSEYLIDFTQSTIDIKSHHSAWPNMSQLTDLSRISGSNIFSGCGLSFSTASGRRGNCLIASIRSRTCLWSFYRNI